MIAAKRRNTISGVRPSAVDGQLLRQICLISIAVADAFLYRFDRGEIFGLCEI